MKQQSSLISFWDAIDAAMKRTYGIDTFDAEITAERIRQAWQLGATPDDAAYLFARKLARAS
jgi:hypothetical protein